jgi:uncharacterized protein YraI
MSHRDRGSQHYRMGRLTIPLALAVVFVGTDLAWSQTAVVKQNANLRRGPSSNDQIVRLLTPPEELRLLSLTRTNNYYNVATNTDDEEGWVYGNLIEVIDSRQVGKVERNTNLRSGAGGTQPIIRLMPPGEEVEILDRAPTNNYLHVKTAVPEDGWAYRPNIAIVTAPPSPAPQPSATPFPNARDEAPSTWTGHKFQLSQNYPTTPPAAEPKPWKAFNFRTQAQAAQYLQSVLDYAKEGNVAVQWDGDQNAVRKWYHAPWLHRDANGREYVRGLTRERTSPVHSLHALQANQWRNYAVGLYNPAAGYIVGQVWKDHENPDATAARFPDGSVGVKLLFTTATVAEVPYLVNSFDWDAHVSPVGSDVRTIQKVRLLQIDVAVRDARADSTTGWVFGTFIYDGTAAGATPWDRMRPVGLTWGNDPTLTPAAQSAGATTAESIILTPTVAGHQLKLGWLGRLNGPVDNPASSCLSCHGTAQTPHVGSLPPAANVPIGPKMVYFRNLAPGVPFRTGDTSLDYSLQLEVGIRNFLDSRQPSDR